MMQSAVYEALTPFTDYLPRGIAATQADLEFYSVLLQKWQRVQNLVSRETLPAIWSRHFADSLQILFHLKPEEQNFLDLGSGGGLPAIPLAIALKDGPAHFTLIEPNGRKASFLKTIARELSLPVMVLNGRSDQIDPRETKPSDVITARGLAPLSTLCSYMAPFFLSQTRALLHKGREHGEEIIESAAVWHHDVLTLPSHTDDYGVLIELKNLRLKNR